MSLSYGFRSATVSFSSHTHLLFDPKGSTDSDVRVHTAVFVPSGGIWGSDTVTHIFHQT